MLGKEGDRGFWMKVLTSSYDASWYHFTPLVSEGLGYDARFGESEITPYWIAESLE